MSVRIAISIALQKQDWETMRFLHDNGGKLGGQMQQWDISVFTNVITEGDLIGQTVPLAGSVGYQLSDGALETNNTSVRQIRQRTLCPLSTT
jgi:hypothetical protein